MKKILLIITLFILVSCTSKLIVEIDKYKIELNKEDTFGNITYMYSDEFKIDNQNNSRYLTYLDEKEAIFRISLNRIENMTKEEALGYLALSNDSTEEINNIKWTKYIKEDDYSIYKIYASDINNDTYIISFIKPTNSKINLNDLIELFLSNLKTN